jgi:hypothetical protein
MMIRTAAAALGLALIAACSQGSSIASPGASNPGTPPGGGTGGGGGGGTGGATCPAGFTAGTAIGDLTTCIISGTILTNTTLRDVDGIAYRIQGRVDVGSDVGADGSKTGGASAVLTVEPGVTIFGSSGSDYMVVNRGSRLEAAGTLAEPIIFTSAADIQRRQALATDLGGSNTAEWGGLVILGRAPNNRCTTGTPGTANCEAVVEGVTNPDAVYGGGLANDNSGTLRYLQVRFAGFAINSAGNELNGITLAGVGSGTVVDYVQVHNNEDDGIELFGGTVNLSHVVLTGNKDESLDTDNGWNGGVQYMVIVQNDTIGDNVFEMSSAGATVSPASDPQIANFTVVGKRSNAFRLNTGTIGKFVNGVVTHTNACFNWQSTAGNGTAGYQPNVDPEFNSVLFDCNGLTLAGSDVAAATDSVAADANNTTTTPNSLSSSIFPGPNELAITPFDATTLGPFFEAAPYVGAFSPSETPTSNWASGWTFGLFPPAACPVGTTDTGFDRNGLNVCRLSGVVTSDLRLTRGNIYEIANRVDIGVDVGADGNSAGGAAADLTIEAGVTLYGNSGADYMVVNRGSKIFANGTVTNPVVFTSENDLTGTQADPINTTAEWGGLVILGRAPNNRCTTGTPGTANCEAVVEGVTNPDAVYGGGLANDSSGSLQYVQVKYAGFAINSAGNELNGITLAGVGSGTVVDYVQVHNNEDDGIELFGGTVNLSHVVLTGNKDESLDTDNGWNGGVQYMVIVQNDTIGDNVFEMSSAGATVSPASDPQIANFTVVGKRSNAFRLNTGTIGKFVNGVVTHTNACFNWQSTAGNGTAGYQPNVDPEFNSVLFDCNGLTLAGSDVAAATDSVAADANNTTTVADSLLAAVLGGPAFINGPTETGITAFDATTLGPFFEDAPYVGAVRNAQDTWWQGWSCGLEGPTAASAC